IAMRRSLGNRFTLGTWLVHAGGWMASTQWFGGDFNGDGLSDLAAVWDNGGNTTVAVYASNGQAFPGWSQWITTAGWDPTSQWVAGDFNGDGATDLATMWNSGVNTMAMRLSTRSGFSLGTWLANGGGFSTSNRWVAGTFTAAP
ncbi:MAG TPA: VCBS repeat-containing protein, partial [Polyangiaceae bacterium]